MPTKQSHHVGFRKELSKLNRDMHWPVRLKEFFAPIVKKGSETLSVN